MLQVKLTSKVSLSMSWRTYTCFFKSEHEVTITPKCHQSRNSWQLAGTFHQGLCNHSCQHQVSPVTCLFCFKTSSQSAEGTKEGHLPLLWVFSSSWSPPQILTWLIVEDLQLFTGILMTGRAGPSNSSMSCTDLPIQQNGLGHPRVLPNSLDPTQG